RPRARAAGGRVRSLHRLRAYRRPAAQRRRARVGGGARAGRRPAVDAPGRRAGGGHDPLTYWAHPTAVVDRPSSIGDGTKIWHFCHVMAGARIGAGCVLGQNVFVGGGGVVGDGCRIQNNVSIYDGVELGQRVFVGPSAVFTNVVNPRAFMVRRTELRPTRVRDGATIGANATVVCGVTVGELAFVAAGAVVT